MSGHNIVNLFSCSGFKKQRFPYARCSHTVIRCTGDYSVVYIRHEIALSKWIIVLQFINYSKIVQYAREIQDGYKTGTYSVSRTYAKECSLRIKEMKIKVVIKCIELSKVNFRKNCCAFFCFLQFDAPDLLPSNPFQFFQHSPISKKRISFWLYQSASHKSRMQLHAV